jgi:hypothetical protein
VANPNRCDSTVFCLTTPALKAAALELGIYDGSGALTDQQKILAAQKVFLSKRPTRKATLQERLTV